jgi:predicted amidophosphoribosyltransferase
VAYDGVARRFLLRAKLSHRAEILPLLGAQLASALAGSTFPAGCQAVIPVPSHPISRLRRGFDPAREIARPVASALSLPLVLALRRRLGSGGPVKQLSAAARARTLQSAFARGTPPLPRGAPRGRRPDHGGTAAACIPVLRARGEEVRLVWARTRGLIWRPRWRNP